MSCRITIDKKAQANRPPTPANRKPDSGWTSPKSTRPPYNDDLALYVSRRLTDRDRSILALVADHRVFTTDQLAEAFFTSPTTARHRLTQLHQLRLLQRFAPFVSKGSAPYHYVLDRLGAEVVAAERGVEPKRLWRQDRALVLGRSRTLGRIIGANGFFTALMGEARRRPECRLVEWWSAARCAEWRGDLVRPDGYGAWEEHGRAVEVFLDYDPAGDDDTVQRKFEAYAHLADALGRHTVVLLVCRSLQREAAVRRLLAACPVPVATAVADTSPCARAAWLPIGHRHRTTLVDLAALPGRALHPFARPNNSMPAWYYREGAPY